VSPAKQFGANVSRRRKELSMTQEDLAYAAGLHPTAISHIEQGKRDTRFLNILKLAGALDIEPGRLFEGVEL
jgi:transcriptional regulator with XRE-family HTH domain